MKKLKLLKGTRFTSFLFIAVSLLIAAGIILGANIYYDIDTGKIMVAEVQRIVKSGATALEVIGIAKLGDGGATNFAEFSETGDLTFRGGANVIEKTDGALFIQTTGALNLAGAAGSIINFPNFDVADTGHITVQPGYGLDTNAAGVLKLGDTTATTVDIGTTALARTINIGTGGAVDTINIGTGTGADAIKIGGGGAGATLAIDTGDWDITTAGDLTGIGGITADQWSIAGLTGNITTAGDLVINGGDITTAATTFNLINSTATTVNFAGAATTLTMGATTGTTTIRNNLTINGATLALTAASSLLDATGALTVEFKDGTGGGFILRGDTPFTYLEIGTDGKLTLRSRGTADLVLDSASGKISLGAGDQILTSTGGAASRLAGEEILRAVVPIFGFDLPAQTASTTYRTVSRTIEDYPFADNVPTITGTTRVHKIIIRYADTLNPADPTLANRVSNWQVWNVTTGLQFSTFDVPATPGTTDAGLEAGEVYLTGNVTIPTGTDDWRLDVKLPVAGKIRIYQIFLAAYDKVQ